MNSCLQFSAFSYPCIHEISILHLLCTSFFCALTSSSFSSPACAFISDIFHSHLPFTFLLSYCLLPSCHLVFCACSVLIRLLFACQKNSLPSWPCSLNIYVAIGVNHNITASPLTSLFGPQTLCMGACRNRHRGF